MNKQKPKKRLTKRIFFVLVILAAMLVVPVSANESPIFAIEGKTTNVFPNEGMKTFSTAEYGPLNIPQSFLNEKSDTVLSFSSDEKVKYNLVTFDDPISIRSDIVKLPITLYGKSYTAILEKSPVDSLIDGMDGYIGTILELENSRIVMVVTKENLVTATIELGNDYLVITPAQNQESIEKTANPLHVIYSETDLNLPEGPIEFCGTEMLEMEIDDVLSSVEKSSISSVALDVYFATDNELYNLGGWTTKAYQLLINAYDQYARSDFKVILINRGYDSDSTKRQALSSHSQKITFPLQAARDTFSTSYLTGKNADVLAYIGGNDQTNPSASTSGLQNHHGYAGYPGFHGRIFWVQMVPDIAPSPTGTHYDASVYAQTYTFIHELGHILGANHRTDVASTNPLKFYVMRDNYEGSQTSLWEFSSNSITEMTPYRSMVSNYASY